MADLQFLANGLPRFVGEPVDVRLRFDHQLRTAEGAVDGRDDVTPVAEVHVPEGDVFVRPSLDLVGHLREVTRRDAGHLFAPIFVRTHVKDERGVATLLSLLEDAVLFGHLVKEARRRLESTFALLVFVANDLSEVGGREDFVELAPSELTVVEPMVLTGKLALDSRGGCRDFLSLLGQVVWIETGHVLWSLVFR